MPIAFDEIEQGPRAIIAVYQILVYCDFLLHIKEGQAVGLTCTGEDRDICIALSGEVDHHRARGLMDGIGREIDMRLPRHVTLDLGGVTFMDSSGIAVLLRAYKRTAELGGAVSVRNIPDQADKVLRAAGLERLMKFERT